MYWETTISLYIVMRSDILIFWCFAEASYCWCPDEARLHAGTHTGPLPTYQSTQMNLAIWFFDYVILDINMYSVINNLQVHTLVTLCYLWDASNNRQPNKYLQMLVASSSFFIRVVGYRVSITFYLPEHRQQYVIVTFSLLSWQL